MKLATIYGIWIGNAKLPRYVGQTGNFRERIHRHLELHRTVAGLYEVTFPEIKFQVLEEVKYKDRLSCEVHWIQHFKSLGARLSNITTREISKEHREKISRALKGRSRQFSLEHRGNLSKAGKGHKNPNARLTAQQVLRIRELAHRGISQVKLAEIYNVHRTHISKIVSRKRWRCIEEKEN